MLREQRPCVNAEVILNGAAIYEALSNNKTLQKLSLTVSMLLPGCQTYNDSINRTPAPEQSPMPSLELCQHSFCGNLDFRFEKSELFTHSPGTNFPKRCVGTCKGLQNFSEALGKNRSLTALSISVNTLPLRSFCHRKFTNFLGVARNRHSSCNHSRRNEHS